MININKLFLAIAISLVSIPAPAADSFYSHHNFLVLTDIHLDASTTHKMDISPSKRDATNDLDQATFITLLDTIKEKINDGHIAKPEFIILLGDITGHDRMHESNIVNNEATVFTELSNHFPNIPILYTPGNNDSLTKNYGPFNDADYPGKFKSPYDIATLQANWRDGFISSGTMCPTSKKSTYPCIIYENKDQGYYSAYLKKHLRVIAVNSIMFSVLRTNITDADAQRELVWLGEQLKSASKQGDSVLIIMHVPPGKNMFDDTSFWQVKEHSEFIKTIVKYKHNIIGILSGHTHNDELKLIKDQKGNDVIGVYLIAALSTSHGNQPSVKTFYMSKHHDNWSLTNYETFGFSERDSMIVSDKLYDYQSYYCQGKKINSLSSCFNNISVDGIAKYFMAGNPNLSPPINAPQDYIINYPDH